MTYIAYIGLGSNVGATTDNILRAVEAMQQIGVVPIAMSECITTAPVGDGLSGMFSNAVAKVRCELAPELLLAELLHIERQMGRDRSLGADRIIDLDVLVMRDAAGVWLRNSEHPTIPHPRMWERDFVMVPLGEVLSTDELRDLQVWQAQVL